MTTRDERCRQTLRNAFDVIDKNGDGELQKSEFLDGCSSLGIDLKSEELENVFKCIDTDASGLFFYIYCISVL